MPAFVDLITNPENYGRLYKPKAISAQTTVDILKTIAEYVNSRVLSRVSDLEDYPDHDDDDGYHGGADRTDAIDSQVSKDDKTAADKRRKQNEFIPIHELEAYLKDLKAQVGASSMTTNITNNASQQGIWE
ncbi:hypothetical protein BGZ75_004718 [Mortierella antarctica]|nr:hypothetical protein BGZ75_004718 [Mortierella antarctica]